jgi:hypothetical protein
VLVDARPRSAQFTPNGKELWVSSEVGGADPKVLQKISFDIPGLAKEAVQPVGIRFSQDGAKAFIALGPANRAAIIDVASRKIDKYLLVGQRV